MQKARLGFKLHQQCLIFCCPNVSTNVHLEEVSGVSMEVLEHVYVRQICSMIEYFAGGLSSGVAKSDMLIGNSVIYEMLSESGRMGNQIYLSRQRPIVRCIFSSLLCC